MNFSEIINNSSVSLELKRYNRYMNEHNDEINLVQEDIMDELTKLYSDVIIQYDGTIYVSLNKEFNESDKMLVENIISHAIDQHIPSMPVFLKDHLFHIHCIENELFIKVK